MTKKRIYNKDRKVVGTLKINSQNQAIEFQFAYGSEYQKNLVKHLISFLKENNLIIVNPMISFRRHNKSSVFPQKIKFFDTYYIRRNIRNKKREFIKLR